MFVEVDSTSLFAKKWDVQQNQHLPVYSVSCLLVLVCVRERERERESVCWGVWEILFFSKHLRLIVSYILMFFPPVVSQSDLPPLSLPRPVAQIGRGGGGSRVETVGGTNDVISGGLIAHRTVSPQTVYLLICLPTCVYLQFPVYPRARFL